MGSTFTASQKHPYASMQAYYAEDTADDDDGTHREWLLCDETRCYRSCVKIGSKLTNEHAPGCPQAL